MVIAASLLGALTGIVTGLVPGIHVNTVTALLLASSASCASLGIEYSALLAFTCALAISHTFFDVVPGLFLGIPGDESFALLPGHRLVTQGRGTLAMRLSVVGSALGLLIGLVVVAALLMFGNLIGALEEAIGPWMFFILAGVSLVLIVSDSRRGWSLVVFLASGLLGVAVFGSPLIAGGLDAPVNAFFPALAGLFGVAGLLFAIGTASGGGPPPPPDVPATPTAKGVAWPGVRGGLAGLLVGLLPGLGAANAATLLLLLERWFGRGGDRDAQDRAYLVTTSSLNTSEALFAIAALYLIGRSRSGASIAVEQILGGIVSPADLGWIALFMIAAGVVAAVIMWRTGAAVAARFQAVDQNGLNWSVVAFLVTLTLLLLGAGGLVILICATAVGLIPLVFGVRRAQLMGFFLVPTMLFYSGVPGDAGRLAVTGAADRAVVAVGHAVRHRAGGDRVGRRGSGRLPPGADGRRWRRRRRRIARAAGLERRPDRGRRHHGGGGGGVVVRPARRGVSTRRREVVRRACATQPRRRPHRTRDRRRHGRHRKRLPPVPRPVQRRRRAGAGPAGGRFARGTGYGRRSRTGPSAGARWASMSTAAFWATCSSRTARR